MAHDKAIDIRDDWDCWKKIGIWAPGGRSCEKLTEYIHCRNCPVYQAAGQVLLRRQADIIDVEELPVFDYVERGRESLTCFRIGIEWFAIETEYVSGVINPMEVRKIPHRPSGVVEGVCYTAGDPVLVFDLCQIVSGMTRGNVDLERKSFERFLLLATPIGSLALRVDEVWGTEYLSKDKITHVSAVNAEQYSLLVSDRMSWGKGMLSILDYKRLCQMFKKHL